MTRLLQFSQESLDRIPQETEQSRYDAHNNGNKGANRGQSGPRPYVRKGWIGIENGRGNNQSCQHNHLTAFHVIQSPAWGSRKNKLVILGVEAPGRQRAESQEYLDSPRFYIADGPDISASKMASYF
jgi:hypothetical protein